MVQSTEFNAIRISLASPEQIRRWSFGEVTKPETINYRTLKPEKDGLFCERIFGPVKDYECYCGKYKRIRYREITCERCGVTVTRSKVRRERMGHIELAAPVAHIWFSKGTPSRLGLLLDLSPRSLERILYFAQFVITKVSEEERTRALEELKENFAREIAQVEEAGETEESRTKKEELEGELQARIDELEDLRPLQLLTEMRHRELRDKYRRVFEASMGAEAILEILKGIDIEKLREELQQEVNSVSGQRRKKVLKRLRVVEAIRGSSNKSEHMVLTVLPVLPPDLRPMVQLDGGRFATSDLNDLYRRVINRNNRLKRLLELGAPDIIVRNEKRMLQEAVDALIDNGRRGRAVANSRNHKLKCLSDMLRGKQGRFRQNLLGKRVDYSGRSVVVVGPELKLHQCGLPKRMALELFKPFVMHRLVASGLAHNIKSAKRLVERARPEIWDILEEVIKERPVLLNRAPTLHRLGIQAFEPVLIEGSAIQIHPLVCTAFNADFDGDQMAVHVPLSQAAVREARKVMLSIYNMLSPASGEPIVVPTLDIVLGSYYLTTIKPVEPISRKKFSSPEEAMLAHDLGYLALHEEIDVKHPEAGPGLITTTVGRLIFNQLFPSDIPFINKLVDKKGLKELVVDCYRRLGNQATSVILDSLKQLGFHYVTKAGITISVNDIDVPTEKGQLLERCDKEIIALEEQFQSGLITEEERYERAVGIWREAMDQMTKAVERRLPSYGGVYLMAASGAKGNISQITQMAGMRGVMSNPKGRYIDIPVRSSFREGLTVLEYFISTHGARKGLADTALRTADSGYLTRRLIDASQELIILEEDCGTKAGLWLIHDPEKEKAMLAPFEDRILGRMAAAPIADPTTGEVLVERNAEIDEPKAKGLLGRGIDKVYIRSPMACEARRGVCRLCYGRSPASGQLVLLGEAVGIIAAESIGEPGTQLTMRTFHTGGVAGLDITSGLPRVEELFEARVPKGEAILSDIDGAAEIVQGDEGRTIRIVSVEEGKDEYPLPKGYDLLVAAGERVEVGAPLAQPSSPKSEGKGKKAKEAQGSAIVARIGGLVALRNRQIVVSFEEREVREYRVPPSSRGLVENGQPVKAGAQLTEGLPNPHDILRILGREAVEQYLVEEVQKVYRSQGVSINDKHIEVICRQMLKKVRVESPGDTSFLPGELVDKAAFEDRNAKTVAEGGEPATAQPVLLGVTKASLTTDSFLAAASFQETARVLTEAAVQGSVDHLLGLKENVIIGRLIPARLDISEEGRRRLGLPEPAPALVAPELEVPWLQAPSGNGEDGPSPLLPEQ